MKNPAMKSWKSEWYKITLKVLLEINIRCLRESIKHLTEFFPSPNKAEGSFENLPRLTCLVSYSLNASVLNYTVQFSNKITAVVAKPNQEHKIFQLKNENPVPLLISKVCFDTEN